MEVSQRQKQEILTCREHVRLYACAGGLMQEPVWKPTQRCGTLGVQRMKVDARGFPQRIGGLQPKVRHRELSRCAKICRISVMHSAGAAVGASPALAWL